MVERNLDSSEELDGVIAAPESHRVLYESDRVRVLAIHIPPGVKEPFHTHKYPSIMLVIKSSALKYYTDDEIIIIPKREASDELPIHQVLPPEKKHAIENIGTEDYIAERLEFKNWK